MKKGLAVVLILLSGFVQAADYYVTESGSGARSGADWNNAFQGLPTSLVRGSTYFIADGKYGDYVFDDQESGSQYITIKKAVLADHGTGTGWQDSFGDGQAVFSTPSGTLFQFASDYYIIEGSIRDEQDWKDGAAYGFDLTVSDPDRAKIFQLEDSNNAQASNIRINRVNAHFPNVCFDSECYLNNILYYGRSNIYLGNSFMENTSWHAAIRIGGTDGFIIENNYFRNINRKELISDQSGSMNIIFRNNIIENSAGTAVIAFDNPTNWQIYNNLFFNTDSRYTFTDGIITTWTGKGQIATDVKIHGNTFFNMGGATRIGSDGGSGNEVYNNIFYGPRGVDFASFTHDYNACGGGTSCSEANSQSITNGIFVDYNGLDYRLGMATGKGKVLPAPFDTDMLGITRGQDGVWDIGAYEFVSGSCTPSCTGKVCGDNGCGSSCGACSSGESCSNGKCVTLCSPSCAGKVCGDNGCGGTCGICSSGYACNNGACASSGNLIVNGDFESGFTDGLANNWLMQSSATCTASKDIGHQGNSQKIQITSPGSWGMFIYQMPPMVVGKTYEWTFWYKSDTEIHAEISDGPANIRPVMLTMPASMWKNASIRFTYSDSVADQVRFSVLTAGSFWIDDVILKESCETADTDCDGCIEQSELLQQIQNWKSGSISLAQLMEAIRQWKQGC